MQLELDLFGRFAELYGNQQAMDRVRNQAIPAQGPTLDYIGMSPYQVAVLSYIDCASRFQRRLSLQKTGL